MKVSLNLIRYDQNKYGWSEDVTAIGADKLLEKIGAQLGAVEEVIDIGKRYNNILIVKVVECSKLEGSDHLNVCMVDDGKAVKEVSRDDRGLIQVVCGAPNVHAGMLAVWLPPGTTVPATVDTQDPFVLSARQLRGVVSNGMLASPRELALGDSHEGILELEGDWRPGQDFVDALGLKDDIVIDLENKMFTHRPDCFGFMGIARELAGIQGLAFKSPDWYGLKPVFSEPETSLPLVVRNELPELVPRFAVIVMSDVKVGPSPTWLQIELAKVGQKSINNIVDYTNFFMLQTGQPLHAYDYDKLKALSGSEGAAILTRNPKPGEKLKLLNGKEIEPRPEAILIATDQKAIGLGGVMGGSETEVDETTHNIVLECATFDMYSIRRTSMAHGLFTEAVTRFSKGQSPLQNAAVLSRIVSEIQQAAGGKLASRLIDHNHLPTETLERGSLHPPVKLELDFINVRLGLDLKAEEVQKLLQNVEFRVEISGSELTVTAPFWRTDIELREDVVEEVGRLYGFDKLPLELPKRNIMPAARNELLELKQQARQVLATAGGNEVLTYSFVHGDLLDKTGQDKSMAFRISNALSPDLQYYRLSLMPSLLEKIHPNIKAGYDRFALFELGKSHVVKNINPDEPDVPREVDSLAWVLAGRHGQAGAPYYSARYQLMELLKSFHVQHKVKLESLDGADLYNNPWLEQTVTPFEPGRSAVLRDEAGLIWGVVGEFSATVRRSLKLPDYASGFEIDPTLLVQTVGQYDYKALPRFPKVTQDISLKVKATLTYQTVYDCLLSAIDKAQSDSSWQLSPLDIYQRPEDKEHKQMAFRLEIANYQRTLNDKEVNQLLEAAAKAAAGQFGAERI